MATSTMRAKWSLIMMMGGFSRQKAECLALLFILGTASVMVTVVLKSSQPLDGSTIDLSEQHQQELIEEYKKDQKYNQQLYQRQKELERLENRTEKNENLFLGHVNFPKDTRNDDTIKEMNLTQHMKENPMLGGKPPGLKKRQLTKKVTSKPKTKKEFVKYYDPSIGRIIMKPVIKEETELQGGPGHCAVYDLSANVTEEFECVTLSIRPRTRVCLYPDQQDIHISRHIRQEGIWEPHIIKDFQNILYGDPDLAVIDIGANIGVYSLIAATMGHKVLAIEPFMDNIKHLQKAAQLGGVTQKITVLKNALSDSRGKWYLTLQAHNQGGVSLQLEDPDPDCTHDSCKSPQVDVIHMNDLLEVITFDKAVLKIDIEGYEHRAFLYSEKLLDKVYIPYIFMEWMKLRKYYGSEVTESEDKDLTHRLVSYLTNRGFQAFSSVTMEKLNPSFWVAWTDDIIWKHELREFN